MAIEFDEEGEGPTNRSITKKALQVYLILQRIVFIYF